MGDTKISWTHRAGTRGRTWNPTQGCWPVSPGCANCYACRTAARFSGEGKWAHGLVKLGKKKGDPPKWTGESNFAAHKLIEPLSWREPSTIFVDSMSDLYWDAFSFEQIAAVYGIAAYCHQHVFQILTKRSQRRLDFFEWIDGEAEKQARELAPERGTCDWDRRASICWDFAREALAKAGMPIEHSAWNGEMMDRVHTIRWPLPNVWEGVSAENQDAWNERVRHLSELKESHPEIITFVSCEPLLGPIDIDPMYCDHCDLELEYSADGTGGQGTWSTEDLPDGKHTTQPTCNECGAEVGSAGFHDLVDLVIAGCESGPRARPCEADWFRQLRDACAREGITFFLKQAEDSLDGVVKTGDGSRVKPGGVIELPYLDGVQHKDLPGDVR